MLKFNFQVEPWEQVRHIKINTLYAYIELKEDEEYASYEHNEFGQYESVKYKFRLKKRQYYKDYLKDFINFDIDMVDLKNLVGTMSYFREMHQYVMHLFRRGIMTNLTFRWNDKDIHVSFGLFVKRDEGTIEVQSELVAEYGNEYISLYHSEKTEYVEDTLEHHTKEVVGLYLLFKDYLAAQQEGEKT
jgi:hypothetical protein